MKKKLTHLTVILCTLVLSSFISYPTEKSPLLSTAKIDGKYKQLSNTGQPTRSHIIKEYKQGEFIEYIEDDQQKVTQYEGVYTVINDSVYEETVEYDLFKKFQGQVIPFKYEFKGDTMIQSGEAQYKREIIDPTGSLSKKRFVTQNIPIRMYWLKIKE